MPLGGRWARAVLAVLATGVGACAADGPEDAADPPPPSTSAPASTVTPGDPHPTIGSAEDAAVEVTAVLDGDTFDVLLDGSVVERVRIIGVNAPESGECFASEATAALDRLLAAGPPTLVADESARDRFGRLLRYVEVDGADVGAALVRDGFAVVRVSAPDRAREAGLRLAQADAQAEGVGIWASDACGAATLAAVEVVGLRLDADGPDEQNLNDEWVEVGNEGDERLDLTGWVVRDESSSHRFAFPDGFTLAPGATVRIRSGCGDGTSSELFWCETGSAVWNNDGDTAFLLDPNGNVVDTLAR